MCPFAVVLKIRLISRKEQYASIGFTILASVIPHLNNIQLFSSYSKEKQHMSQIRISNCCLGKFFFFLVIKGNLQTRDPPRQQYTKRYTQFLTFHASTCIQPVPFLFQLLQSRVFNELICVAIHFHGNTICTAKDSQTFRTSKKSEQIFSQTMPNTKYYWYAGLKSRNLVISSGAFK
jgi:hypothetical protein